MSLAALAFQGQQITKPPRDRSREKSRAKPNPFGSTKLSGLRNRILLTIKLNRTATRSQLIRALGCTAGGYKNCTETLVRRGEIEFIGHANYGYWRMK